MKKLHTDWIHFSQREIKYILVVENDLLVDVQKKKYWNFLHIDFAKKKKTF